MKVKVKETDCGHYAVQFPVEIWQTPGEASEIENVGGRIVESS